MAVEHADDEEGLGGDPLWGSPTRISDWLAVPLILSLLGIAWAIWLLSTAFARGLTVIGWITVLCAVAVVAVSGRLASHGYRAYVRMTAGDTYLWLRAQLFTYSFVTGIFLLAGVVGGTNMIVIGGIFGGVGVHRWSASVPVTVDPEARISHTGFRASAVLALLLLVSSIATALIGFTLAIPSSLSSRYIGGAFIYVVLAAIGLIYLWRNRVHDPLSS